MKAEYACLAKLMADMVAGEGKEAGSKTDERPD